MSLVSIVRKHNVSKVTPRLDHSVRNKTVHWGMSLGDMSCGTVVENGELQLQEKPCQSDFWRQKQEEVWRQKNLGACLGTLIFCRMLG